MGIARNLEYADAQARVRARIGAMPNESAWRYIADAADLDNLIARMRASGLGHWVKALPRSPDTATIEHHLGDRLQGLIGSMVRLLPDRWQGLKGWLRQGAELVETRLLMTSSNRDQPATSDHEPPRGPRSPEWDYLNHRPNPRHQDDGDRVETVFDLWVRDFAQCCPKIKGRERYVVQRIHRIVSDHLQQIVLLREQAARSELIDINAQWRLRHQLASDLRSLLGGDPFHAGVILIYGLLELLQYEKCRALLIAQSRHWGAAELMVGGG